MQNILQRNWLLIICDSTLVIKDLIASINDNEREYDESCLIKLSAKELVGTSILQIDLLTHMMDKVIASTIVENVKQAFAEKANTSFELSCVESSGFLSSYIGYISFASNGDFYLTIVNISQQLANEVKLEQHVSMLDSIYKNLPIGVVIILPNGTISYVNDAVVNQIGKAGVERLYLKNFFTQVVPQEQNIKEKILSGEMVEFDTYYPSDNGLIDVNVRISAIISKNNQIERYLLICRNVTFKRQMERQIEEDRKYQETIDRALPIGIAVYNSDGSLVNINDYALKLYGIESSERIRNTNLFEYDLSDEVRQRIREGKDTILTIETDRTEPLSYLGKRYVEIKVTPIFDKNHQIESYILSSHDNTELITRNFELEQSNKNLDIALSVGGMSLWIYSLSEQKFKVIRGKSLLLDNSTYDLFFAALEMPASMKLVTAFTKVLDGEEHTGEAQFSFTLEDKPTAHCKTSFRGVYEMGKLVSIVGITENISSFYFQQEALEEEKRKVMEANTVLREIVERLPSAIYFKDAENECRYVIANDIYCKSWGLQKEEVIGKNDYEIFEKEIAELYHEYDMKLLGGMKNVSFNSTIKQLGREDVQWQISKSIIEFGNKKMIIGVATDVTALHLINAELNCMKDKAEKADKLKSAFLANMSHEIRTPLNAIVGFSELLYEAETQEDKDHFFGIIKNNNETLLRLVGDILDLSKIEAGMIDLRRDLFDMAQYFNELAQTFKSQINNEIEFIVENPYKSCVVYYDKNRFAQAVNNYMSNAIKYTKKGYIKLGYKVENGGILFYVSDSGIGISDENKDKVFQRFEKLDNYAQGNGLGLSIVKALSEAYGGKVGFESKEGVGSTFWAWTPSSDINFQYPDSDIPAPSIIEDRNTSDNKFGGVKKLLVAEDNDSNYLLMKYILSPFELSRANDGLEAVDMASKNEYDAILMDVKMPNMDGLEATRKIRTFNTTIPIVAITANAFVSDKEACLAAGCDYFITKPVKKAEIFELLTHLGNK